MTNKDEIKWPKNFSIFHNTPIVIVLWVIPPTFSTDLVHCTLPNTSTSTVNIQYAYIVGKYKI